jgi:Tol biopolymer transport system component/DNA-binding winged helix-turn-helix (wHTH) protein
MMMLPDDEGAVRERAIYEFGDFRVDMGRMALTRADAVIPLEPKAFDVLVYLVEHRGGLVTKDELLDAVWAGTFVTPNVLTRAVAQIRKALGDEAEDARFIETVSKRGYRFIPGVSVAPFGTPGSASAAATPPPSPAPAPAKSSHRGAFVLLALGMLSAAGLMFYTSVIREESGDLAASTVQLKRLTSSRGYNGTPALSQDGRALVYASDVSGALELHLASLTSGAAHVQLTRDGGSNVHPAWSPDGQWIAYHSRKRGGVWVIPATGGTPQQVADFGSDPAWSPDSGTIVFTSDAGGLAGQSNLWTVKRDGSDRKALTQIGTPAGGHRAPAWSHDGRLIAFTVSRGGGVMQIWLRNLATGEQQFIENAPAGADPAFAPDDRALYWGGATPTGNGRLLRRALDDNGVSAGATEVIFTFDGGFVENLGIAVNGTMVFAGRTVDANLWAVDIAANGQVSQPARVTDDVARSTHPDYAADGRIAYYQTSVGSAPSVWVVNDDGTGKTALLPGTEAIDPQWDLAGNRMLVTRTGAQGPGLAWIDLTSRRITPLALSVADMLSLRLSPDAKTIAFHTIEQDGRMNVWMSTLDGKRTQIATDREAVSYPVWSPDGKWLALELKRGDSTQLAVMPSAGGPVVQLTDVRGQNWPYDWAPDNERIVFAGQRDGVWNVYTISRITREVKPITAFTSPAGYIRYPIWSPRGSRVVFERSSDIAQVWTATLDR